MRVAITIDPRDARRGWAREDAEFWLRHHARDRWRTRENEDLDGREVLTFEFTDPLDGLDFQNRIAPAEHRRRVL